jgi:hypothetical protein
MRKLPAATQEERRRQVIGPRQTDLRSDRRPGRSDADRVFDICKRFAAHGAKGLVSASAGAGGRFRQGSRQGSWPAKVGPAIAPPLISGAGRDAVH